MFDVKDRVAVVTGSARGLGKEIVERLLRKGAKVVVSDLDEDEGRRTEQELAEKHGKDKVLFLRCDVTDPSDWRSLWQKTEESLGQISLLVNNAGVNSKVSGSRTAIDVMLMGAAEGLYLAFEKMSRKNGGQGGRIINVASLAGVMVGLDDFGHTAYHAAKFGIVGLTRSMTTSVIKGHDIKVYALCPWFVRTRLPHEDFSKIERKTMTRILEVSEVGDAFECALRHDKNAAVLGLYPDAPLMNLPNAIDAMFAANVVVGKFFHKLNLFQETPMGLIHVAIALFIPLLVVIYLLSQLF